MNVAVRMPAPIGAPPITHPRLEWLDAAKGVGIVLVVFGHALGGLIDSRLGAGLVGYRNLFFAIYTFHMPLFFLLAGLSVGRRIEADRPGFVRGLGIDIVWPYFLWSAVQFSIIFLLGSQVNQPAEQYWPTIAALPWQPVSQYWFLYVLFLLHLLALAALPRLGGIGFVIVGVALQPLPLLLPVPDIVRLAALQAPFYAVGAVLGAAGLSRLAVDLPAAVRMLLLPAAAVLLVVLVRAAVPAFSTADFDTARAAGLARLAWDHAALPAAVAGIFAAVGLASLAPGTLGRLLRHLGRRSMPIFVLHVLGIAGVRIVGVNVLGIGSADIILAASFFAGLAFPLAAFAVAARLGVTRIAGLGRA